MLAASTVEQTWVERDTASQGMRDNLNDSDCNIGKDADDNNDDDSDSMVIAVAVTTTVMIKITTKQ